jgi:hypothetical protein
MFFISAHNDFAIQRFWWKDKIKNLADRHFELGRQFEKLSKKISEHIGTGFVLYSVQIFIAYSVIMYVNIVALEHKFFQIVILIFDCAKQSLKSGPHFHTPIHPSIQF